MGYDLHYPNSTRLLAHHDTYPGALHDARGRAARQGRTVLIKNAWDGSTYSVVSPDGSVSSPAQP